ncbi:MAG: Glycosyltransferase, partial [Candidatus Kuenenbacteria bacterium GW2011_GWA2_42_15]
MFSIIIPCKKSNDLLKECLDYISKLDYADFEIIVLPDECVETQHCRVSIRIRIIPTGPIKPGAKRNIGAQHAQGEILAFIDDDAYPALDWLKNALKYFEDEKVAALGGPGLTPFDDSFWQQVSGAMYLSWFAGANPERFYPGKKRFLDDWPSMNFLIRKNDFLAVGGFAENFWPGEDTALCHNLVKAGKKILYCPDVLVYHHR